MAKNCEYTVGGKKLDYDQVRAYMLENYDKIVPPKPKEEPKEPNGKRGRKSLLNRAVEGGAREGVKKKIREYGLDYDVENLLDAKERAKNFIEDVGDAEALEAVRRNEIEDSMAAFVWAELIDRVGQNIAEADESEIEELQQTEAALIDEFDRKARSGGRFIRALAEVYEKSNFGYKASTKIKQYKERNGGEIPPEVEAKFKEYEQKLNEVNKRIEELEKEKEKREGEEAIKTIKAVKGERKSFTVKAKKAADKFRKLKSKPFIITDSEGNPIDIKTEGFTWNDAIEAGAKIIESTGKIADGVAEVIRMISEQEWFKALSPKDKKAVEAQVEEYFMREELEGDGIKVPASLIRELVESGVDTIEELSSRVLEQIKEKYPDATLREVRDVITGYGKKLRETAPDIQSKINEQKRIGRLLSELEDLRNGIRKEKNATKKKNLTDKEKDLIKKIKDESKKLGYTPEQIEKMDEKRLADAKERIRRSIENLQERLKNKDFSKKEKRPYFEDDEMAKLRAEKRKWQDAFDHELYTAELKNRSLREKIIDNLLESWNLTRALMATGELSFMLVQGGIQTLSHPRNAARALYKAFQHFASEKKAQEWGEFVKSQPWYETAKKSKLSLSEFDARLAAREEQFLGGWVNNIWDIAGFPLKFASKSAYEKWKKINFFKALERAGVGYLNTLRILRFLDGMEMLRLQGKNFASNPQSYKDVADVINTLTGRASLGPLENMSKPLSVIFFSPRNWASILKTSSPLALYHFGKMGDKGTFKPSVAQKMAAGDFMKFVGLTTGVVIALAAKYNNDDDEETEVILDPLDTNFGKVRVGKTYIDPWGGRIQQIVFQARMWEEAMIDKQGKRVPLGQSGASTRLELAWKLVRSKFSPSAGLVSDYLMSYKDKNGKRVFMQREYDGAQKLSENLYPMYVGTLNDLWKEQPETVASFLTFYALLGGGISTYETNVIPVRNEKQREFYNKYDMDLRGANRGDFPELKDEQFDEMNNLVKLTGKEALSTWYNKEKPESTYEFPEGWTPTANQEDEIKKEAMRNGQTYEEFLPEWKKRYDLKRDFSEVKGLAVKSAVEVYFLSKNLEVPKNISGSTARYNSWLKSLDEKEKLANERE